MNDHADDPVRELERRIAELKACFPAHSISPALMAELDDLEEQLAQAKKRQADQECGHTPSH